MNKTSISDEKEHFGWLSIIDNLTKAGKIPSIEEGIKKYRGLTPIEIISLDYEENKKFRELSDKAIEETRKQQEDEITERIRKALYG